MNDGAISVERDQGQGDNADRDGELENERRNGAQKIRDIPSLQERCLWEEYTLRGGRWACLGWRALCLGRLLNTDS